MLEDARIYWNGSKLYNVAGYESEQAFDDVLKVGPMTRHLCRMTGHYPRWVSERFIK
jgi:hypothetical protein